MYKDVISEENGFKVTVPIDYKNPSKGTTEIFAYWAEGSYDPKLPTFIAFDGGPGGNSHGYPKAIKEFNELHYDQRGIGCSKPATLELYKDHKFYSSENNVRDADMIRKHLGVSQVSLYGISYGTIPATMYAHMFPESTRALVLEGIMYDAEKSFGSHMISSELYKVYQKLPPNVKAGMKAYFNTLERGHLLYSYAKKVGYEDLGFITVEKTLLELFSDPARLDLTRLSEVFDDQDYEDEEGMGAIDDINNSALVCKEFRYKNFKMPFFVQNSETNLLFTPITVNPGLDELCIENNFPENAIPYSAKNYPVKTPITYFQGTWDSATDPQGASLHYQNVPQGFAQLVMAGKGGHGANYTPLVSAENKVQQNIHKKMLFQALRGESIDAAEVQKLNSLQSVVSWWIIKK